MALLSVRSNVGQEISAGLTMAPKTPVTEVTSAFDKGPLTCDDTPGRQLYTSKYGPDLRKRPNFLAIGRIAVAASPRRQAQTEKGPTMAKQETTAERDANATGAGRKAQCKYNTPDGPCVLWLNHEGSHDAGLFDENELAEAVPSEETIAALSIAERDPVQVTFDEKIARNWTEFVKAGKDKPQWRELQVRPAMSETVQRKLRNGADFHNPPVGVRINASFIPGGKVRILYAAVTRREYKKSGQQ